MSEVTDIRKVADGYVVDIYGYPLSYRFSTYEAAEHMQAMILAAHHATTHALREENRRLRSENGALHMANEQAHRKLAAYQDTLVQLGPTQMLAVPRADEPVVMPTRTTLAALLDKVQPATPTRDGGEG